MLPFAIASTLLKKCCLPVVFFLAGAGLVSAQGYKVNHVLPKPALFQENLISKGDYETHPAFSPSGDTVYFLRCKQDLSQSAILVSYFKNGKWSEPGTVSFSGKYVDIDPFVTKDGNTIYFSSNRPVHEQDTVRPDMDIWRTQRAGDRWSAPVHLEKPISSPTDEYFPGLADNGTLYFGSAREGGEGNSDIYRSVPMNGNYSGIENLGNVINTADNEYEPYISPDESYLIFMATIPKGLKNADLYISYHTNGEWTRPEKIKGDINSAGIEWGARVTRDNKYLFFGSTRDRAGSEKGMCDIYQVDLSAVGIRLPAAAADDFTTTLTRHLKAIQDRDLTTLLSTVDDSVVLILPDGKLISSRTAFEDMHKAWFAEKNWTIDFDVVQTRITPALGMAFVKYTYTEMNDKKEITVKRNTYLTLSFRKKGNSWLLIHDQNTRIQQP